MGVLLQPVIPLFVSCRAASQQTSKAAPDGRGGGGGWDLLLSYPRDLSTICPNKLNRFHNVNSLFHIIAGRIKGERGDKVKYITIWDILNPLYCKVQYTLYL